MTKVIKALAVIFGIGLLVAIGYFVVNKGFVKEEPFTVQLNGTTLEAESNLEFNNNVKQTFNISGEEGEKFTYKITPNKNATFSFYIDDVIVSTANIKDFTKDFEIKEFDSAFVLSFGNNFSMQTLLENKYPGSEIILGEDYDFTEYHFTLTIASTIRDMKYVVNFKVASDAPGVVLDKTMIIF